MLIKFLIFFSIFTNSRVYCGPSTLNILKMTFLIFTYAHYRTIKSNPQASTRFVGIIGGREGENLHSYPNNFISIKKQYLPCFKLAKLKKGKNRVIFKPFLRNKNQFDLHARGCMRDFSLLICFFFFSFFLNSHKCDSRIRSRMKVSDARRTISKNPGSEKR